MSEKLAIVICTRNRKFYLDQALASISRSKSTPYLIYLVSSGEKINHIVDRYVKSLNIIHIHTENSGQSLQKKLAIDSLAKEINWVFFVDDDLLLEYDTLCKAEKRISETKDLNVGGIGTRLIAKDKIGDGIPASISLRKLPNNSGTIRKSGRAVNYMYDQLISTNWLNGASIWRKECLQYYNLPVFNSKYAAYDDVIFSSNVFKSYGLLYDPEIKVIEQIAHANVKLTLSQFKYITLWTGYLVCSSTDTKILHYKGLTVIRTLKFLEPTAILRLVRRHKLIAFLKFLIRIISLPIDKTKSSNIIIDLLKEESTKP